jgi:hypothetical protein
MWRRTGSGGSCRRPRPPVLGELTRQQHPRPLAPGLSRRPCSAAYGLGPSMFTIRATKAGTGRASVSQAVARRGTPPLPPMSLGACRRCCHGGTPWPNANQFPPFSGSAPRADSGWRYVDIRPTGGGGRAPSRPEENFATAICFLMEWCVKSLRTDGLADDRTRWPKRRRGCTAWVNHYASACVGLPWRITLSENMVPR